MRKNNLKDDVNRMRNMASILIPHTYPKVGLEHEQDVLCLKQSTLSVDSYRIRTTFSIAEHADYTLETLQMESANTPFLPFNIVCKLGQFFLGDKNLFYVDFFRINKKIYCWALKRKDGEIIPPNNKFESGFYEGFEYSILDPSMVDFF